VSHDLRNPLSAILFGAESLLRRDELDDRTVRTAARIRSSAERALRLTNDLLDYTQARLGGGIAVERTPGNLNDSRPPGRGGDAGRHADRTVSLALAPDTMESGTATGSPRSSGTSSRTRSSTAPRGRRSGSRPASRTTPWSSAVHNEGPVIAAHLVPGLFEPLQRAGERDRASRSVGLGLYIVKHLVEAHGGRVSVLSEDGQGTTFEALLPRR
jgi:signal transduction histidine kinase